MPIQQEKPQDPETQRVSPPSNNKKPYHRPEFIEYGDIHILTQTTTMQNLASDGMAHYTNTSI